MNLLLAFDTETTGLPNWKVPSDDPSQPHMAQLAAHVVDIDERRIIQSMDVIIRPDGWVIPDEVANIHGITTEYAMVVGIPELMALQMFLALWEKCKFRVAHNTTFDNRIIRIAIKRYLGIESADQWKEGEYKCTGLLSKPIMKMLPKNKYGYKMPKLSEAYQYFFDKELEDAHTAIADVNACLEVYWAIQDHNAKQALEAS